MKYKAEEAHISEAAGRYATNFKAEVMALTTAATEIPSNFDKIHKQVVFFSDALSVLVALQAPTPTPNRKKKKEKNIY